MLSIFDGKILEERIVRIMRSNTRVGAGLGENVDVRGDVGCFVSQRCPYRCSQLSCKRLCVRQ